MKRLLVAELIYSDGDRSSTNRTK